MKREDRIAICHLYYNAPVLTSDGIGMIHAINHGAGVFVSSDLRPSRFYGFDEIQLLLSALSEITDEDAIEAAKIALPLPFHRHKKEWKVSRDFTITGWPYIKVHNPKNVFSFQIDCTCCWFSIYNMDEACTQESDIHIVDIIDYLRSHRYALPYKGQDLFEAGIAIKSK